MLALFLTLLVGSTSTLALEIHGHRGSRGTHPENSLPAFQEAVDAGADVLEMDLGLSQDGVLVVAHDPVINASICQRTDGKALDKKIIIRKTPLKELKKIDCGSKGNHRFPGQKIITPTLIPSFEEVLLWLQKTRNHKIRLNVETKFSEDSDIPTATPQEFAQALAGLLKKYNRVETTVIQSFDFRSLVEIRKLLPNIKTAMLIDRQSWDDIKKQIPKVKAQIISPRHDWLDEKIVIEAHKINLKVIPWTANETWHWERLHQLQVDGIITDYPRKIKKYMQRLNTRQSSL